MSREIKFRAWDIDSKSFLKGDFSLGITSGEFRGKYGEVFKNVIVIQFTGLKDKNGVEIYEGDILDNEYNAKGVVLFINGMFIAKFTYNETILTKDNQTAYFRLYNVNMVAKIIGNIHENAELL